MYFIFFLNLHKQALWWQDYITEEKKNVQGVCIHTILLSPRVSKYVNTIPPRDDVLIRTDNLQLTLHYVHCNKYTVVNRQTRLYYR